MPNTGFIETMGCLPVSRLPKGPKWTYEIFCVAIDNRGIGETSLLLERGQERL